MKRSVPLMITAEPVGAYLGYKMLLNGELIGYRPYDGSDAIEACDSTVAALAEKLGEHLGWSRESPEDEDL